MRRRIAISESRVLGVSRVATRPEKVVISVYRREYGLAYDCKAHFLRPYYNLGKTT